MGEKIKKLCETAQVFNIDNSIAFNLDVRLGGRLYSHRREPTVFNEKQYIETETFRQCKLFIAIIN